MSKRTKISVALSSFFLSFLCLSASTFAWYSLGREAKIESVDIFIKGEDEIKIGLKPTEDAVENLIEKYPNTAVWQDGIYYVDEVNQELLLDFGYILKDQHLYPVSASHEASWLQYDENGNILDSSKEKPQFMTIPYGGNYTGNIVSGDRLKNSVYQFEFYFKTNSDLYLFLNEDTSLKADSIKNSTLVSDELSLETLNSVEKAMRLSTYSKTDAYSNYTLYNPAPNFDENGEYISTRYAGRMNLYPRDNFFDYSLQDKKEILYGSYTNEDKIVYSEDARVEGVDVAPNDGRFYIGNSHPDAEPVDIEKSEANGLVVEYERKATVPSDLEDKEAYESVLTNSIALCPKDVPTKVYISLWAEGWDDDCTNAISSAYFGLNLGISAQQPIHFRP